MALTAAAVFTLALTLPNVADAQSASRKVGRGLAAMTTAFLEIPGNMTEQTRKHGAGGGLPLGFALGVGKIVPRVLVGVYEFITAPFPAPADFRVILKPEFPWGYFDEQPTRR